MHTALPHARAQSSRGRVSISLRNEANTNTVEAAVELRQRLRQRAGIAAELGALRVRQRVPRVQGALPRGVLGARQARAAVVDPGRLGGHPGLSLVHCTGNAWQWNVGLKRLERSPSWPIV